MDEQSIDIDSIAHHNTPCQHGEQQASRYRLNELLHWFWLLRTHPPPIGAGSSPASDVVAAIFCIQKSPKLAMCVGNVITAKKVMIFQYLVADPSQKSLSF